MKTNSIPASSVALSTSASIIMQNAATNQRAAQVLSVAALAVTLAQVMLSMVEGAAGGDDEGGDFDF